MDKILLTTNNHLGDTVICTSVIMNIKKSIANLEIGFSSNYMDVFNGLPIDHTVNKGNARRIIKVEYAPFSQKNANGGTCCECFNKNVNKTLFAITGKKFEIIHNFPVLTLSTEELAPPSYNNYWVLNANFQARSETKAYPWYQKIVDLKKKDVSFIQIGSSELRDRQTPLSDVLDLRGKTSVRELIRLVYHSRGVIGPPSSTTHIAQAFNKPCITIGGCREPEMLTKHPLNTFFSSPCPGGFNQKKTCLKFLTSVPGKKTCKYTETIGGIKYPVCMCGVKPECVAEFVS